ncbi:malonyl-ACP O-methyltransferase BioC [Psychromonas sp. RZ22]|uniref:malonyl-ACP O-methyltransferase BioC n=1 Tax=Psychromonas algarum TaxID=2555643 RepID=UPI001068A0F9|nr:malonyl-ACP O-methyltransferase BioC [Psychromonas sp. RZ22]TEW55213.1 malonyl-ACP O-methyltransferase BioC [Psychromonas sp. RZ22]
MHTITDKEVITNKVINKKAIEASFSKAALFYDQYADLQRDIGHHLMMLTGSAMSATEQSHVRAKLNATKTTKILDLGCGTGYFSTELNQLAINEPRVTCFDLSPKMLAQTALRNIPHCCYVEGDIDALPFTENQFDLIFSNLVLQWSQQLQHSLQQIKQALNDNGLLCFSTLLDGSLMELKEAWKQVDNHSHINTFLTEQEVKEALYQAGYKNVTLTTETRVKKYNDVVSVMKALKGIGANHVHDGPKKTLSGRNLLKKLQQGYQPFVDTEGLYNLSYQVCYVVACR